MSIKQILAMIWVRRWLVLVVSVVVIALGSAFALTRPRQYVSESYLVVDMRSDPMLGNFAAAVGMATQLELVKSQKVAMRAARILLADKRPEAQAQLDVWRNKKGELTERVLAMLLGLGLQADSIRGSNIIGLTVTAPSGELAQAAVNALASAAIEVSVQLRVEPARESAEWLADQTKVLRSNLEAAQARLSAFQQEKGIVVTDDRMSQEVSRLNALESALVMAETQRLDGQSSPRVADADSTRGGSDQVVKTQLLNAEAKLAEVSATLGTGHPQRVQLETQIASLRQQLSASSHAVTRASAQKVEELRRLVATQKEQVLALRSQRDQIAVLLRDIQTAQTAYETASQRVGQLSMESQNNQAGVRLLSAATDWSDTSQRKLIVRLLTAVAGGIGLGLAAALGLELLDRRVRSADDLLMDGIPLVGVLQPVDSRRSPLSGLPVDMLPNARQPLLLPGGGSR